MFFCKSFIFGTPGIVFRDKELFFKQASVVDDVQHPFEGFQGVSRQAVFGGIRPGFSRLLDDERFDQSGLLGREAHQVIATEFPFLVGVGAQVGHRSGSRYGVVVEFGILARALAIGIFLRFDQAFGFYSEVGGDDRERIVRP